LLNYFLSPRLRKEKKEFLHNINKGFKEIYSRSDSDEKLLIDIYRSFSSGTAYYLIKYLAFKKFFNRHNYKTITSVDENSPARRAILDAARINGIKVVAVQHGNIYDLHPSYLYTTADKTAKAMPDLTLVWGKVYKEFLAEKANYPEDGVMPIGQIRTDIIPKLLKADISAREVIKEVPEGKHIITFASQPQKDVQLRKQAALDVMLAIKKIPDTFLVVKLHPNELNDFGYYHAIAREAGITNYTISYHVDLYMLLAISSVVITCFSTVGSEAVYFNKALIILDYQKQDLLNYIREGVAFPAYNEADLQKTVSSLLNLELEINAEAYNKFIDQYAYKIDGKVVDRALDAIRNIC